MATTVKNIEEYGIYDQPLSLGWKVRRFPFWLFVRERQNFSLKFNSLDWSANFFALVEIENGESLGDIKRCKIGGQRYFAMRFTGGYSAFKKGSKV